MQITEKQALALCGAMQIKETGSYTLDSREDGCLYLVHSEGQTMIIAPNGAYDYDTDSDAPCPI